MRSCGLSAMSLQPSAPTSGRCWPRVVERAHDLLMSPARGGPGSVRGPAGCARTLRDRRSWPCPPAPRVQPAIRNSSASSARDPADPDHRDAHRARGLPGHAHGDGPDGGAGEAAGAEGRARPARLDVDREAQQRVDAGERVGARLLARPREQRDVGHVRRELGDDGQRGRLAHRRHHLVGHLGVAAEGDAALLHVGAGDVDLQRGHARPAVAARAPPRRTPPPCRRTR